MIAFASADGELGLIGGPGEAVDLDLKRSESDLLLVAAIGICPSKRIIGILEVSDRAARFRKGLIDSGTGISCLSMISLRLLKSCTLAESARTAENFKAN